jgi:hypothetical protein
MFATLVLVITILSSLNVMAGSISHSSDSTILLTVAKKDTNIDDSLCETTCGVGHSYLNGQAYAEWLYDVGLCSVGPPALFGFCMAVAEFDYNNRIQAASDFYDRCLSDCVSEA